SIPLVADNEQTTDRFVSHLGSTIVIASPVWQPVKICDILKTAVCPGPVSGAPRVTRFPHPSGGAYLAVKFDTGSCRTAPKEETVAFEGFGVNQRNYFKFSSELKI
ncbi:unnamed protein product, partial [Tenebrio molitor]